MIAGLRDFSSLLLADCCCDRGFRLFVGSHKGWLQSLPFLGLPGCSLRLKTSLANMEKSSC